MPRLLIGDGFDFEFTSKPTDRTAEPVTIKYRPPTPLSLAKYDRSVLAEPEAIAKGQAEFLAENIGEWNVVGPDDKPLPLTVETFLKVRDWNLLRQFCNEIQRSASEAAAEQKK